MSDIKKETISGVKWQFISKLTLQPVTFIFGMILARLITPEEMGILALTSIFFVFAELLKDSGFGAALIRKQDRTDADINTVFWFNVGASLLLCITLCLAAPWFVILFDCPPLLNITRVSAIMLFINSTGGVHWTLFSAKRNFKTPALISVISAITPMPFTIWAAYSGWSYWSLIAHGVASGLISLSLIWIASPWKPRLMFSRASLKEFFSFGSKILASNCVVKFYGESRNLIIGLFYSPMQLAFFHRAIKLGDMPISLIQGVVGSVAFPILSTLAHDEQKLIDTYRKYFRLTIMLVSWTMLSVVANSSSLVYTLYGAQWMPSVFYAQILVLGLMLNPVSTLINTLIMVKGRVDITLKLEFVSRTISMLLLVVAACHSVAAVCIAAVLSCIIYCFNLFIAISRVGWLKRRDMLSDALPYLLVALAVNVPAFILNLIFEPYFDILLLGAACSLFLYIAIMHSRYDRTWAMLINLLDEKKLLRFIPFIKKRDISH